MRVHAILFLYILNQTTDIFLMCWDVSTIQMAEQKS